MRAPENRLRTVPSGVNPIPRQCHCRTTRGCKFENAENSAYRAVHDTEQIPLLDKGDIDAFLHPKVLRCTPGSGHDPDKTELGYKSSVTRYFYNAKPLRSLDELHANILAMKQEADGVLNEIT